MSYKGQQLEKPCHKTVKRFFARSVPDPASLDIGVFFVSLYAVYSDHYDCEHKSYYKKDNRQLKYRKIKSDRGGHLIRLMVF
jgi:hypothetical protein